jgi:hypothetical protein
LRREDAGGEVGDLEELGGGAAGGFLVDQVFAAVLGGVAADGGGGVADVAVEDERQGVGALVELGGGGETAAAGVGEFGLGEDLDGFVAGEIHRQGGDGGAEGLGDVIDRTVGALEEIEQVLSLRRRWIEDVDAVPHCGPHVPGDSAERSRRVMGIVSRIEEMVQESELCSARKSVGSVTDWRTTTALCARVEGTSPRAGARGLWG